MQAAGSWQLAADGGTEEFTDHELRDWVANKGGEGDQFMHMYAPVLEGGCASEGRAITYAGTPIQ